MIKLKRIYDDPESTDGTRILVERLWPRGMKRSEAALDAWMKEVAPSPSLRTWFSHDVTKWNEFRRRYYAELDKEPENWQPLALAAERGQVTLVYSSHDAEHNNAVALKEYLESKIPKRKVSGRGA